MSIEAELELFEPTPFRGRLRKPPWLVKRFKWRPWRYEVENRRGTVTVYNFPFDHRRTPMEEREAVDWIDWYGNECDSLPEDEYEEAMN